jgi:hypothetical protein
MQSIIFFLKMWPSHRFLFETVGLKCVRKFPSGIPTLPHCKMSSRVSIRLVGFVAVIRLSLTVWQGKRLNSSCLPGQTVKLSHLTLTKPTSQLNKSTSLAKIFQQFGFSTLSRQTNRQVEWILDKKLYSAFRLKGS